MIGLDADTIETWLMQDILFFILATCHNLILLHTITQLTFYFEK